MVKNENLDVSAFDVMIDSTIEWVARRPVLKDGKLTYDTLKVRLDGQTDTSRQGIMFACLSDPDRVLVNKAKKEGDGASERKTAKGDDYHLHDVVRTVNVFFGKTETTDEEISEELKAWKTWKKDRLARIAAIRQRRQGIDRASQDSSTQQDSQNESTQEEVSADSQDSSQDESATPAPARNGRGRKQTADV